MKPYLLLLAHLVTVVAGYCWFKLLTTEPWDQFSDSAEAAVPLSIAALALFGLWWTL